MQNLFFIKKHYKPSLITVINMVVFTYRWLKQVLFVGGILN